MENEHNLVRCSGSHSDQNALSNHSQIGRRETVRKSPDFGGFLDNITVNSRPPENKGLQSRFSPQIRRQLKGAIDRETGEIIHHEETLIEQRVRRYILQSAIRECIPNHRIKTCLRNRISRTDGVHLLKNRETGKCTYGNLMVCGSSWVCPVCISKITEVRRQELKSVLETAIQRGFKAVMVTKTCAHQKQDSLKVMNQGFSRANDLFHRSNPVKHLQTSLGMAGYVRSHEITFGSHGWHPHYHEIWILQTDQDYSTLCETIKKVTFPVWSDRCLKSGLREPKEVAFHVRDAESSWDYVNKYGDEKMQWGASEEMTKGHLKTAKFESLTLLGLAEKYFLTGDKHAKHLIAEYAVSTYRKRALVYSRGLKKEFMIDERTDEQIAQSRDEKADLLGQLTVEQWKKVLTLKHVATVQHLAEKGGMKAVLDFVSTLTV